MSARRLGILQQAALQIGAGGSAGFIEVCVMHPLDVVKTRIQIQGTKSPEMLKIGEVHYKGIFDCIKKIYKHEGLFSFYRGIIPPLVAETPKRALKFFTFEQYQQFFLFESPYPTPATYALAGACSGVSEAIFVNPFEVVKVTMQANRSSKKERPGTWAVTKKIVEEGGFGFRGLNKGLSGTIARNAVFNMVYFGFYHSTKSHFSSMSSSWNDFLLKFLIGFVSGSVASFLNIPFDVAKSRMQAPQPWECEVKYRKLFPTMETIFREEGLRALYKGLLPKVMRLGTGGAIMLLVYDHVYGFLLCDVMS